MNLKKIFRACMLSGMMTLIGMNTALTNVNADDVAKTSSTAVGSESTTDAEKADSKEGWIKLSGEQWAFVDPSSHTRVAGWHQAAQGEWTHNGKDIAGEWFHLGDDTIMDKGWFKDKDSSWYYLADGTENGGYGAAVKGWYLENSVWYYFDLDTCRMTTGWKSIGGMWYYFNQDGSLDQSKTEVDTTVGISSNDNSSADNTSANNDKTENTTDAAADSYVCKSFEGTGKQLQDNFNKFLRENVWCQTSLSNEEKIKLMKENFDNLTPEQKVDFNVLADSRVINNPDYSNWGEWADIAWPESPGLDKETAEGVYDKEKEEIEIPEDVDRIGSPYGSNLAAVEDGRHATQSERSICYIENEYARNVYKFDKTYYKDAIDAIKDYDISNPESSLSKINTIIDKMNEKNNTDKPQITEETLADWSFQYKQFQNEEHLTALCKENNIDSTYGVMGKAAKWEVKGELITTGGCEQINIPVNVKALEDMGIVQNKGRW